MSTGRGGTKATDGFKIERPVASAVAPAAKGGAAFPSAELQRALDDFHGSAQRAFSAVETRTKDLQAQIRRAPTVKRPAIDDATAEASEASLLGAGPPETYTFELGTLDGGLGTQTVSTLGKATTSYPGGVPCNVVAQLPRTTARNGASYDPTEQVGRTMRIVRTSGGAETCEVKPFDPTPLQPGDPGYPGPSPNCETINGSTSPYAISGAYASVTLIPVGPGEWIAVPG